MKNKSTSRPGFFNRHALLGLVLCMMLSCSIMTGTLLAVFRSEPPAKAFPRTLTFAERVSYQRAIENVYWRHRIWPNWNPGSKPPLDAVMSQAQLEEKVKNYLRNSQTLEDYWRRPITSEQLQAEMDRMARHTKQPEVLRELFEALGNDPFVIAECLARPALSERSDTSFHTSDQGRQLELREHVDADVQAENQMPKLMRPASVSYTLPTIQDGLNGCIDDTWIATSTTSVPDRRGNHTAVWTGSEMIVWGGFTFPPNTYLNTGGIYNPATDSWTATSITNAPDGRVGHTAVWTGSAMIVWGGFFVDNIGNTHPLDTGGRYNPTTNSWTATSTINAPGARWGHTAVWTGSEMIIWGGSLASGGRYNPSTDSWTATSTINAPGARSGHTAVWTGSEMIVWGGSGGRPQMYFNTGGRYNPSTDSWTATSTIDAPHGRDSHTAVWTGSEMIVWGGEYYIEPEVYLLNTGGRYDPSTDSWTATSTTNAPTARDLHTAVWTGNNMIVWGGDDGGSNAVNTGGTYNPSTDSWMETTTLNAPDGRAYYTAVRTASEMIVWGGTDLAGNYFNTGGRYCAESGSPTPTVTPIPTPSSTPVPTPRATPTPRPRPTPAPHP